MSHTQFHKSGYKKDSSPLLGDIVMAGPVDKQTGFLLVSFLAATLHVNHPSLLTSVLILGSLGSIPQSKDLALPLFLMWLKGRSFQTLFASLTSSNIHNQCLHAYINTIFFAFLFS
jgi:hypothetical protein